MAMTVNNLASLTLLNQLNRTQAAQDSVFHQMSTGSKVSRGRDDPAGLIALTSLESELTSVDAALSNTQRADAVVGVAEGALSEIGNLVGEIQRLANEATSEGGLSADEIAANQAQIDDALASIDRIISNTKFNGSKLLDGSMAINADVAGADLGKVTDIKVYSRRAGTTDTSVKVDLDSVASEAAVTNAITNVGGLAADTTISVQGKLGTAVFEISSGEGTASIITKINNAKAETGVSASDNGGDIQLTSSDTGESAFVRVSMIEGDSASIDQSSDEGVDAVVRVNGQTTAVDGDHVTYSGDGTSLSFELGSLAAGASVTFTVKGASGSAESGATFQLGTDASSRATIGIDGLYTHQLGTASDGYLASLKSGGSASLLNDPNKAAEIARKASGQVATIRGRLGGFQKFQVETAANSLSDVKEGLEKAASVIRDVDYAAASAELNRQNILQQSAMSLLGLANQQAASVLSLL